jgi:VanZ family protein
VTRRTLGLWGPVVLSMAVIFGLSSMSSPPLPGGDDKMWHFGGYTALTLVVVRAVAGGLPRRIGAREAVTAVAIVIAYALSDEWHQSFVPGRSAALDDLAVDAACALLGTALCWAWGIIAPASRDEL